MNRIESLLDYLGEQPAKAPAVRAVKASKTSKTRKAKAGNVAKSARKMPAGDALLVMKYSAKLSSAAVGRLAKRLDVPVERVLMVSAIPPRTYQRRKSAHSPLNEIESDRLLRVARVAKEAERVFGDESKASRWLSAPSRILSATPLDLLGTDAGAREVEDELVRIEYGDLA